MFGRRIELILHDDALGAAAGTLTGLTDIHLAFRGTSTEGARTGRVRGHILVVAADLTDEVVEGVLDVDAGFGGGLNELAPELSGQSLTLCFEVKLASPIFLFDAARLSGPVNRN